MTQIEKNLNKIESLTKEAKKYLNNVRFSDNSFIQEVQASLYASTMKKIAKLEAITY